MLRIVMSALVAVATVVTAAPPASATARTCQGRPATVVGVPDADKVKGTPGDDVIVTNGAFEVLAGDGDDLVCATVNPRDRDQGTSNIRAGKGDDVVIGHDGGVWVELGEGADVFSGGTGPDSVVSGRIATDDEGTADIVDVDHDVISTGDSGDLVGVGQPGVAVSDVVDLGPGEDELYLHGTDMTQGALLDLGDDQHDELVVDWPHEMTSTWLFDNRTGHATDDVGHELFWAGTELFDLWTPEMPPPSFIGGDGPEQLVAGDFVVAEMGGGADQLRVDYDDRREEARPGRFDGGAGRDTLVAEPLAPATIDLAAGTASFEQESLLDLELSGVENVTMWSSRQRLLIVGDEQPNRLEAWGCDAVLRAGAGDDRLTARDGYCDEGVRMLGGRGDDRLRGSFADDALSGGGGDDVLVGGPGRDIAVGGSGRDVCLAEVRRSCARP